MGLLFGANGGNAIDAVARGLASGMSRREALRAGGTALAGVVALSPSNAWAAVTGTCPRGHVRCNGVCCPLGEVCLDTGGRLHCGCPHHEARCSGRCVSLASNHQNCGRCGHACASNQVCSSGRCVLRCASGQTNCSGSCVNLQSNVHHCGTCGNDCGPNHVCSGGKCILSCPSGETNCSGSCVATATDAGNCGACGHICAVPNATAGCVSGGCVVASCDPGYGDCNSDPTDGCETPLNTTSNCGACGTPCAPANAIGTCASGTCQIQSCSQGYGDCNSDPTDGCETPLNTTSNCGACGTPCAPANAIGTCASGTCQIQSCNAGYGDCNGLASDGCETQLNTNSNCGGCNVPCAPANGTGTCASGTCQIVSCNVGFADCDGNPANGCETNLNNTPQHCGSCANDCTGNPNGHACIGGTCACLSSNDCPSTSFCSSGTCVPKFANGHMCTSTTQCASGFCAGGICCNTACSGGCGTCSTGTCLNRPAGTACNSCTCNGTSQTCPC